VDATPGVTRDRVSAPCPLGDGYMELIDTGGMGVEDCDNLTDHVEDQITYALATADLILFVVDAREGIVALDRKVAARLRRQHQAVILVANKMDLLDMPSEIYEMHSLGFGEPIAISSAHRRGVHDLRDAIISHIGQAEDKPEKLMKLAIIGKRNAGKSTFTNAIAGEDRVIVSSTPGTTRDSVDVTVEIDGREFTLIDTAGVRKRSRLKDIEFYGFSRAMSSISRSDVVALMIDATVPISQVDKKLVSEVVEQFKPILLVVNKWDLAVDLTDSEEYAEYLGNEFPSLTYAPISLTSAIDGDNVRETTGLAYQLFEQAMNRMTTGELNRIIHDILELRGPSHKTGTRPPKILYVAQVDTCPPTIVLFVNDVRSFDRSYQRFILNQLHMRTPFSEVPIRLIFRNRRDTKRKTAAETDTDTKKIQTLESDPETPGLTDQ